ncbi:MAG TPA: endonuclease/exonuclease/phosphatase family protein [Solirubrobacterales bacterium]|nr:endonuclease/exonuclease/phosphatase family protein [Solirubrobacterales bacterium]
MRIMWWNVKRLGLTTDTARKEGIQNFKKQWSQLPEVVILCELTPAGDYPKPLSYAVSKKTGRQLCYGVVSGDGLSPDPASEIFVPSGPTASYLQQKYKFGGSFRNLVKRTPGVLSVNQVPVYFFHAPARASKAVRPVGYLASYLDELHGTDPWVLLGDFNIEPDQLRTSRIGGAIAHLIKDPDRPTWHSPTRSKKLDYAISNIPNLVVSVGLDRGFSDHNPILISDVRARGMKRARQDDPPPQPNGAPGDGDTGRPRKRQRGDGSGGDGMVTS